jgi:predicted ATP-dependent protease
MSAPAPLTPDELYRPCRLESLHFETTDDLEEFPGLLGQERAISAMDLATGVDLEGYNVYVLGPQGSGRHEFVRRSLSKCAKGGPRPSDWCYVNNFHEARRPRAIELPAGLGARFRDDVARMIVEAHSAIPDALESEEYRAQRQEIEERAQQEQAAAFEDVRENARKRGLGVIQTATGFAFVPLKDGESLITPKEYQRLSEDERERLAQDTREMTHELREMLEQIPRRVRKVLAGVRELDRGVALYAVGSLITELLERYQTFPRVLEYLRAMKADISDHVELFSRLEGPMAMIPAQMLGDATVAGQTEDSPALRRYGVNLLVDHGDSDDPPVIYEHHPTYPYLVGQIEHVSKMGALVTDFHLIRAGALHRANGGYLVMDARDVLTRPFAWDALKRVLKSGFINVQSLDQAYGFVSTVSLEPEPIPVTVKVVLIGEPIIYYLLQAYDPEFPSLFKVAADFETRTERNEGHVTKMARLLATLVRRENLRPLDRSAVARVIEESSRQVGDADMMSTRIARLLDIVREAHHWSGKRNHPRISATDIQHAIDGRHERAGRIRDEILREIRRGTILIDTRGARSGQVNGLAVFRAGEMIFGHPCRITARVSPGAGKVLDIEREVEMGGPIHSKGVLILANFLAARYATEKPLSLSASLVFEQSYTGVEGDSASAAELCALLSAIADTPLAQPIAITGSVNQHGELQPIGGVNQKIEGFFRVCNERGLDGSHGVIVPRANVCHLMLDEDVRQAVAGRRFSIYPADNIDQCMEILTGLRAGTPDAEGHFPEDTVNGRVVGRLADFARIRSSMNRPDESGAADAA